MSIDGLREVRAALEAEGIPVLDSEHGIAIAGAGPQTIEKAMAALTRGPASKAPARPAARPPARTPTPAKPKATPPARTRTPKANGYHFKHGEGRIGGEITEAMADSIERSLQACEGFAVDFIVNSHGGELEAGVRIAKAIAEHGNVRAHLERADSSALSFCAARQVTVEHRQGYQLHRPSLQTTKAGVSVSVEGLKDVAADTDRLFNALCYSFPHRIRGGTVGLLATENRKLTAQEMVTYGLADRVVSRPVTARLVVEDEPDEPDIRDQIKAGVKAALDKLRGD